MDINTGRELRADEIGSTRKTTCLLVVRSWFPIYVGCDINILSPTRYVSLGHCSADMLCGAPLELLKENQKFDAVPITLMLSF